MIPVMGEVTIGLMTFEELKKALNEESRLRHLQWVVEELLGKENVVR